jgi:hypothetical protein
MRNLVCPTLALSFVLSLPGLAAAQVGEISLALWKPTPQLVLSTEDLSQTNLNDVDFVEEFGIEDRQFPEFRATFGRSHKFRISRVFFEYDSEATIQRTFVFRGRTFNIGAPARAEIAWELWKFGYQWDFVSRPAGFVGLIVDLKYNKVRGEIDSPALFEPVETEVKAYVPTIGGTARGILGPLALTGEITGLRITRDDFLTRYLDYDLNAILFFGNFGVQGGLRSVDVNYLIDNESGNLKTTGPYFGAVVKF